MAGASSGLQKALARAGTSVVAIAEMTADDLIAQMTDEQRAALATTLAPSASAAQPKAAADAGAPPKKDGEEDEEMGEDGKPKKKAGAAAAEPTADALAQAEAKGFAAATARAVAVMTHDDFGGRAKAAATLLGNAKLSALSADEIVELLADKPDEGQAAMQAALAADKNPELGTGGNADEKTAASGWKRAVAQVNARRVGRK